MFPWLSIFCIVELNDSMKEKHDSTYRLKVLLSKINHWGPRRSHPVAVALWEKDHSLQAMGSYIWDLTWLDILEYHTAKAFMTYCQ